MQRAGSAERPRPAPASAPRGRAGGCGAAPWTGIRAESAATGTGERTAPLRRPTLATRAVPREGPSASGPGRLAPAQPPSEGKLLLNPEECVAAAAAGGSGGRSQRRPAGDRAGAARCKLGPMKTPGAARKAGPPQAPAGPRPGGDNHAARWCSAGVGWPGRLGRAVAEAGPRTEARTSH